MILNPVCKEVKHTLIFNLQTHCAPCKSSPRLSPLSHIPQQIGDQLSYEPLTAMRSSLAHYHCLLCIDNCQASSI